MTASKQHALFEGLVKTKKEKHGKYPKVGDAIKLIKKLDMSLWDKIEAQIERACEWCMTKDLL